MKKRKEKVELKEVARKKVSSWDQARKGT